MKRCFESLAVTAFLILLGAVPIAALGAGAGSGRAGIVSHVKVLSDKVPDVSSLDAWKRSFIKEGMSNQEKALAIWKTVFAFQYQDGGAPRECLQHEEAVYDAIKMFNVYGYGICSYAAAHVEELGRYLDFGARGWGISGHSVPELHYDGAWHLLDSSLIGYFPKEDGGIASVAEITAAIQGWYKANPDYMGANGHGVDAKLRKFHAADGWMGWKKGPPLLTRAHGYTAKGWWPAGTHGWYSTMQEFDGTGGAAGKAFIYEYGASQGYEVNIQLRQGEKLVRNWGHKGLHIQMDSPKAKPGCLDANLDFIKKAEAYAGQLDPMLKSYANGRIGNGVSQYEVPLASGAFKSGALLVDNIAATADDHAAPAVHVEDPAKPGQLTIRMPSSYVYLSGRLSGKAVVGNGGEIVVAISRNNGLDWQEAAKIDATADLNIDLKDFVYRRYEYRLRFCFKGAGTGLDALTISHDIQHSQRPLPALDRGDNTITFSAGPPEGTITLEANCVLDKHGEKQIEYTAYQPEVAGFSQNMLKMDSPAEGTFTLPVTVPGEMTRLRFGGHYRSWGDEDCLEFQVSFDNGKTFKKVGDAPPQKFGRTAYVTVSDIPAGTRKALVRYVGKCKTSLMLWAFRIDADYASPAFGFMPVKITYDWEEGGKARQDIHVAEQPGETYTIKCADKPKMRSITLELAD